MALDISRQPTGVTQSHTYRRVVLNTENRVHMCLEPPGMFNKVKTTNVNKIGKTYLIICGVLCTVIYGSVFMMEKNYWYLGNLPYLTYFTVRDPSRHINSCAFQSPPCSQMCRDF